MLLVEQESASIQPQKSKRLERWLGGLITAYQDENVRPPNRIFTNLEDMSEPTQCIAIAVKERSTYRCVILLLHLADRPNRHVQSAILGSLAELAVFADQADSHFGIDGLPSNQYVDLNVIFPDRKIGERACLALAENVRSGSLASRGRLQFLHRSWLGSIVQGSRWDTTFAFPLPSYEEVLTELSQEPPPVLERLEEATEQGSHTGSNLPVASGLGFAAAAEPAIWFGPLPIPPTKTLVLQPSMRLDLTRRLIAAANVDGVDVLAYNSGLFFARTTQRDHALTVLNLVFAAFMVSGLPGLLAVADSELVSVTQFNDEIQDIAGIQAAVTPRNALLSIFAFNQLGSFRFLSLREDVFGPALHMANELAGDPRRRATALRLLSALTLHRRGHFTEAFVTGWTLLEAALGREFETYWRSKGRGVRRVREMERDWTANLQIDLLMAAGLLEPERAEDLHRLRRHRNEIVHDLTDSNSQLALECLEHAANLSGLPFPEKPIKPVTAFI